MSGAVRPDVRLLLSILDELPIGVWVARAPDGELTYANGLFADILGIGARDDVQHGEYVPAYGIHDRTGTPYPEDELPFARALRERRTVVVDDIVILRPDGTQRYVRASAKPLFDSTGEISHVMVAFIDISEEVAMEAEHSAAEHRLRAAVNHAPILLFTTDRDGTITLGRERDIVFMTGGVFDPAVAARVSSIPNRCVTKPFDIRAEVRKQMALRMRPD